MHHRGGGRRISGTRPESVRRARAAPNGGTGTIRTAAFTLARNANGTATLTISPQVLIEAATLQNDLKQYGADQHELLHVHHHRSHRSARRRFGVQLLRPSRVLTRSHVAAGSHRWV
jgi:hypothetical protein